VPVKLAAILLALGAPVVTSAQGPPDTLVYNLAVLPAQRRVSVEARLTVASAGAVALALAPRVANAGTVVAGFAATDDRGAPLRVRRTGGGFLVEDARPGAIRFRYRLDFGDSVSGGSTSSGLDSSRLYAVARSMFVAPDPVARRKTRQPYPIVRLAFILPSGWRLIANWDSVGRELRPRSGDDLLAGALAAAPDYRVYSGSVGPSTYGVAVRGRRAFTDSSLVDLIGESLRRGEQAFGPVPVPRVTYISDAGRKGRTSGSLQGTATIGLLWEPGEMLDRPRAHDTFHETLHLWFGGAIETERWWTEGVTDYFAALLYSRWRNDPRDLAELCYQSWRNYERIQHRTTMTMAEESREGPGGDNTILLVYRKGMLAGLLLDAAIRQNSDGRAGLEDAARQLLDSAARRPSPTATERELRDAVVGIGGRAADREWNRVVRRAEPITLQEVTDALRAVTGVDLPPPQRVLEPKVLSNSSNQ